MTLLKTVKPSEASGGIKQIYDGFISKLGKIPNVIQFHTASPSIYGHLMGILNTFSQHPTLDRELLAYLRYIISHRVGGAYCVQFQSYLLKAYGQSDENIAYAVTDLAKLKMDDKRKTLLCFALALLENTDMDVPQHLQDLHNKGWQDQEIYEYCFLGGLQMGMMPLVEGFRVEKDYATENNA